MSKDLVGTNELVFDQLIRSLPELLSSVLPVFRILLSELATKLAKSVHIGELSAVSGGQSLFCHLFGLLGTLLQRYHSVRYFSQPEVEQHCVTCDGNALFDAMVHVLHIAIQACPPEVVPQWSSLLINCFVQWTLLTPCMNCRVRRHSAQLTPRTLNSPSHRQTPSPSAPEKIPLIAAICANHQDKQIASPHVSFSESLWRPTLITLDAMIEVLLNARCVATLDDNKPIAFFIVTLLEPINWTNTFTSVVSDYDIQPLYPALVSPSPPWCPPDIISIDRKRAFVESLTFLLVTLCQTLHTAPSEHKSNLQKILEDVLRGVRLSSVSERCYLYILSHLTDHNMPAYTVLLPPTSMEGRLFGLLSSAGGLIAYSDAANVFAQTDTKHNLINEMNAHNLYPKLPELSSDDTSVHKKRLAYVRKIIGLLQNALLRGVAPTSGLESLESILNVYEQSVPSSNETSPELNPGILTRLTQPLGVLIRKVIPQSIPFSTTSDISSTDPAQILAILAWLRIGNLLSELEAFSGSVSWQDITTDEFRNVSQLCHEVVSLLNNPRPSSKSSAFSGSQMSPLLNLRPAFFVSAMIRWLLGGSEVEQGLPNFPSALMPRSIHAGLSCPLCYTLLMIVPQSDEECGLALTQLLDSVLWSVINFAPNHLSANERLSRLTDIFASLHEQQRNVNIHCCLRDGRLLPVYIVGQTRLKLADRLASGTDNHTIVFADLLHWFGLLNLRKAMYGCLSQLHAVLLYLSLLLKVLDGTNSTPCCGAHPGWSSQHTTAKSSFDCPMGNNVVRLVQALSIVKKSLAKTKPQDDASLSIGQAKTFAVYLDCLGSLLEAWLGCTVQSSRFTKLKLLVDTTTTEANQDPATPPQNSIVASLIPRLPNLTLRNAYVHLTLEFWPELRPTLKQLLTL